MSNLDLHGRIALVTGSTRGIGKVVAETLSNLGATIVISGRQEKDVRAVTTVMKHDNRNVFGFACDVRRSESVSQLFDYLEQKTSGLDILINNAGVGIFGHMSELTPEQWDQVIQTNLNSVFYCSRAAIPLFRNRGGGTIINISSLAGKNAFKGGAAYNASKFGLEGLSEAMMLDLRYENIKVAYVMPGSVSTEFAGRRKDDGDEWRLSKQDVADTVIAILAQNQRALSSRVELRPFQPPQKQ